MPRLAVRRGPVNHPIGDSGRHLPVFELCMQARSIGDCRFPVAFIERRALPFSQLDFGLPLVRELVNMKWKESDHRLAQNSS
jgi:hypothetical protein